MEKDLKKLIYLANKFHDKDAIEQIIKEFLPIIKRVAYKLNYDGAETDIIICLIEAIYSLEYSKIEEFCAGQIVNYIAQIVRNNGVDLYRKRKVYIDEIYIDNYIEISDAIYESTGFVEYLEFLNDKQQKVIIMKYFLGYSDIEIAKKLLISRQAVNKIKRGALKVLYYKLTED